MLWSQIIYGHRTASFSGNTYDSTAPVRRPAGGRKYCTIFYQILDIVLCQVKFKYYLKFHGARTAFGKVIDGKMTSTGHRTVLGRQPTGVCTHWTGSGRFLFKINIVRFQRCPSRHRTVPGRTSYDVWQAPGTFKNLLIIRQMPVRAPADVLWVELAPVRSDVLLQKYIMHLNR